MQVDGH